MASKKLPFPFPCDDVPRFDTQHGVAVFIDMYKAEGHIKRCAHLAFGEIGTEGGYATDYTPKWKKDSFNIEDKDYRRSAFYGCPKDCRLYEPAWKGKTLKFLKDSWWPFRRGIVGTAQWYSSLAPGAQVLLALALFAAVLALAGIPWRETIIEALKALSAK
ncbi:MAG: hypothetical protein ACRD2L_26150 [Terriglobia bacterium]